MNTSDSSFFIAKVKIILLGDPTVGKTSIIAAIRQAEFQDKQEATVGIDFFAQIVVKNGRSYKLQFWDTAGQQRFRSIIPSYVRNANVGIIAFDLQCRTSYESVENWLESFRENSPQNSKIIVVGNKCDLVEDRAVGLEEAQQRFRKDNILYLQISAKTKQNINRLTEVLIDCIDASQSDIADQELRTKSYTKLQKLVEGLPKEAQSTRKRKCCVI